MKNGGEANAPNYNNPVIWTTDALQLQHLTTEECLPVMGGSQVSSILSTLDTPENIPASISLSNMVNQPARIDLLDISKVKVNNVKSNQTNNDTTYIICDLCPFLCLEPNGITEHIDLVHKNKRPSLVFEMKCPGCPNIFFHKSSLQAHLTYDHCISNTVEVAKIVQTVVSTKKSITYTNKLKSTNVIDIDKTPVIIEEFSAIDHELIIPELQPAQVLSPTLNIPKIELDRMSTIKNIISAAKKYNKCTMPTCKVRMESLEKLNYHITCHKDTIFKCMECNEMFPLWKTLAGHLWRNHQIDMELYKCNQCEYRTGSLARLNNTHKLIHGSLKEFACEICEKCFKNAKQLRNHKDVTHRKSDSNEARLTCEECSKTFGHKNQLKIHIDGVHKKLKPYLCTFCGYRAATRSALHIHVRQHTGEKPYKCDLCDYTSGDHNSLRRHKLRHNGEKPYKCNHCDYQCIQSSTYKVHIKTKHPGLDKELLFECPFCHFRSINDSVYNAHLSSQHPEQRASTSKS